MALVAEAGAGRVEAGGDGGGVGSPRAASTFTRSMLIAYAIEALDTLGEG